MFRTFLLFLAWFSIVGSSKAFDDIKAVPECERQTPHDLYFDFSNKGLSTIEKPFVFGPSIKCINLEGNSIQSLEQEVFDDLPELKYLNLARNPVSFDNFMNMHFGELETLVLDGPFEQETVLHDPLSTFYDENRNEYENYFVNRMLKDIPPISMQNLKKLSLRNYGNGRQLTWLNHFDVPNLTHLYVGGNRMTEIYTQETFPQTLTHLNIDNNEIHFFATNYTKLQYLSIDDNKIENICNINCHWRSLLVREMLDLKYLSVRNNNITSIESVAFVDLINLEIINLDMNQINDLPRDLFYNTTSLKHLSLANNKLTEVPYICELTKLEFLTLSHNQITSIDSSSFCNLPNLKFIGLSHSGLNIVSDQTFSKLVMLKGLDLSWNNIKILPENWMELEWGDIPSLDFLNLIRNDFTSVEKMSLARLHSLKTLCIAHNPIKFTSSEFINLPSNINIDLCGDCDL